MPSQPASAIAWWNSNGNPPSVSLLSQYASSKRSHSRDTAAWISCCSAVNAKDISTSRTASPRLNSPALAERLAVGLLGDGADPLVEKLGILTDQDAPFLRLDAVEDDLCCLARSRRRVFAKPPFEFRHPCPDLVVGIAGGVDALRGESFAHSGYIDCRLAALQNFARIGRNARADMARHDDRAFDVRRIQREVRDQRLSKPLDREFCGAIGRVRTVRPERGPEAIDTAGVDDVSLIRVLEQRQKRARAVVNAVPADAKGLFPFAAVAVDKAATATDSGVVEQKMDVLGVEIAPHGVSESQHLFFDRHVGRRRRHPRPLARLRQAKPLGFSHALRRHIAHRDIATHGHELQRQLTPHPRAAPGDDRDLSFKTLHADLLSGRPLSEPRGPP